MTSMTQFYPTVKPPRAPVPDSWFLVEAEDGGLQVLHKWNRPVQLANVFRDPGQRYLTVQNFLREEGNDTAKRRLRTLLEARGRQVSAA